MQAPRDAVRGPAAARRAGDRRARGGRRRAPVPGAAVGAADRRALPRGPPGRRARGLPARPRAARRATSASSPGPRLQGARARDPRSTTARRRSPGAGREPAVARGPSSSGATRRSPRSPSCSAQPARRGRRAGRHRQDGAGDRDRPRGVPARVWLARLEAAQTADDVLDTVIAALDVTGGEAALLERLRRAATLLILDNCEHVADAAAALAERLLDAAPGCGSSARARSRSSVDGEVVVELAPLALDDAVELFTPPRRPARRARARSTSCAARSTACRSRSSSPRRGRGRCRSRRSPAASTTASACCSDPTSRKPERRRALKATIGWSYELLFPDDQRGLWALAAFTGGAPLARGRVRARGARRARRRRRSTSSGGSRAARW